MVKLSEARRITGVNDFARSLGLSPSHVSKVLKGERVSKRVMEAAIASGFRQRRARRK